MRVKGTGNRLGQRPGVENTKLGLVTYSGGEQRETGTVMVRKLGLGEWDWVGKETMSWVRWQIPRS